MELRDRIKTARKQAGLTQKQLADRLHIKQTTISDLETGKQKSSTFIASLADVLGVRARWLEDGNGPMQISRSVDKVPLLDWTQVIDYLKKPESIRTEDIKEWVTPGTTAGSSTFALRVQGDTMRPLFPPGMILIVDPDTHPNPDNYVIASDADTITFKQLIQDGPDFYLRPESDRYPVKPLGDAEILGVVMRAILELPTLA